ncbi:hypothetical protein CTheo_4532 [Ceratobasidium theobromae]|uniref:THUMP domain-containing protein n=1 Tax=Ceratobasidium theobromae TaxID=1582974 RepID=A0A5N5QKI3_9AGAM|nr:hypothetical protein CTheo_4532 [Ceratobasidium theobromae]
MSKRPSEATQTGRRKKRQTLTRGQVKNYKASIGIPSRRAVDGPGIWAMVVKGKEKQATNELYGIIESIADQLWPKPPPATNTTEENEEEDEGEEDIEKQLAKELSDLNNAKSKDSPDRRIGQADAPSYVNWINASPQQVARPRLRVPPIDPVRVTLHHMEQVSRTGVSGTRSLVRLIPASGICAANMSAITTLATELFNPVFGAEGVEAKKYKIELRIRNHQVLSKEEVIKNIAQCVPADKGHTVDLKNQDTTILVEIFKGICTIAVVPDYEKYKRFNVVQIVQEQHKNKGEQDAEGSRIISQADPDK